MTKNEFRWVFEEFITENQIEPPFSIIETNEDSTWIYWAVKCNRCEKQITFPMRKVIKPIELKYIELLNAFVMAHFYGEERRFLCEVIEVSVTTNTYKRVIK